MSDFKSDQIFRPEPRKESDSIGAWEPEALVPPKAKPAAENKSQERIHSWSPPKVESNKKVIRARSSAAAASEAGDTGLKRKQSVIQADVSVRGMVSQRPELAVYRIRNWFFEKPGSRNGGIYSVHPHLRIYITLSLMGAALIKTVYSIMSPSERKQIHQILKTDLMASQEEIETVKDEFINMIQEDLKNI